MSRVLVIAELGINHGGDLATALRLIDVAQACGCDAVKFQKRHVGLVYSPAVQAQPRVSRWGTTVGDQKRGLELDPAAYREIDAYCRARKMPWYASVWDHHSLGFIEAFTPPYHKIASPLVTHLDLLRSVAAYGRPTFLSTGMSTWVDIDRAVSIFNAARCEITLLHCVSVYPCPEADLQLGMLAALRVRYPGVRVGFSSHAVSPVPAMLAIGNGAAVVECHLTLDRASEGSDQAASLESRGLAQVVAAARTWEIAQGDGVKRVLPAEAANAAKLRYWETPGGPLDSRAIGDNDIIRHSGG